MNDAFSANLENWDLSVYCGKSLQRLKSPLQIFYGSGNLSQKLE
jgi:hypothetical protein